MHRSNEEKFDILAELGVIPKIMILVAVLMFVGMVAFLFLVMFPHDKNAPPLSVQVPVSILAGSVMAFFTLLVGYVNRDAKRRGMNYALWTVLVIFIPNAIGYIIYFVVRQPVRGACPQCGATVNPAFNFCPKCKFILHPACPECHRAIELGATFCPYCAADLKVPNASGFHAPSF
jgi:RNA polymerase subunit RPABC4/transcription elongation factor Spt4